MSNKTLIFSDLHLNNWPYGSKLVNGMNSRLAHQREVLSKVAALAERETVKTVVFCGDLFHKKGNIDADVLKVAYEGIHEIAESCTEMYLLAGNHDTNRKDMSVHSLHWLEAIQGVTVVDSPFIAPMDDPKSDYAVASITMFPYTEDKKVLEGWMAEAATHMTRYLFMHQGVKNVAVGSDFVIPNEILSADMIPDCVYKAFTGHYHNYTEVDDRLTIIGAPMQHDWSDSGTTKGCIILNNNGTQNFHDLEMPIFTELNLTNTTLKTVESYNAGFKGQYLRIVGFNGDKENLRTHLLGKGAESVEFKGVSKPLTAFSPRFSGFSTKTVLEQYCVSNAVPDETKVVGLQLKEDTYETPSA